MMPEFDTTIPRTDPPMSAVEAMTFFAGYVSAMAAVLQAYDYTLFDVDPYTKEDVEKYCRCLVHMIIDLHNELIKKWPPPHHSYPPSVSSSR